MGNTPLTVGVKVDTGNKGGIVAGSILRGTIYLSNKQLTTVNAKSIQLKLIGREEAIIHYNTSESDTARRGRENNSSERNRRRTTTGAKREEFSRVIYSLDYTIKDFPDSVIRRGQFEFPFALQLPESLPSSMKAQKGRSKCAIYYEVVAEVYKKPNSLLHTNPHAMEEVIVVALPGTNAESPRHLPTEIIPMSNCLCLSWFSCTKIGNLALEAKLDRSTLLLDSPSSSQPTMAPNSSPDTFYANDNGQNLIGFQFRCKNKSNAKIKAVYATLIEYIEWSVNGHTETVETTLATSRRNASQYPELKAMWRMPFQWEENRLNREAQRLLESKSWRTIDPSVAVDPAMVTDTFRGQSIKVRHVLTLSFIPEDWFTTTPDLCTTVQIYRNPEAFSNDGLFEPRVNHVHSPSAPFENEAYDEYFERPPATTPWMRPAASATAPSSIYDDDNDSSGLVSEVPVAEATALPEDWNAQKAEVVTIPMAEATIIEDTN
jgi:hypothetical protein